MAGVGVAGVGVAVGSTVGIGEGVAAVGCVVGVWTGVKTGIVSFAAD